MHPLDGHHWHGYEQSNDPRELHAAQLSATHGAVAFDQHVELHHTQPTATLHVQQSKKWQFLC